MALSRVVFNRQPGQCARFKLMAAMNDYYGGDEGGTSGAMAATSEEPQDDQPKDGEEKHDEKTALINSDICPGMEVGDEMVLKIIGIKDKEYEVAYAPEPEDKGEGGGEEVESESPMPEGGGNPLYD